MKSVLIVIIGFLALLSFVAAVLIGLMMIFEYPGGMSSSYRATNHDRRLTSIALEAAPIIESIDRYYRVHGHCPQATESDLAELRESLPESLYAGFRSGKIEFRASGAPAGWTYYSSSKKLTACELSRKLGWDPALVWLRRDDTSSWVFVPGDGSKDKVIDLDVGHSSRR